MVFRKHNSTAGFSLIEVLVAITILGFVVVPIGSSLVLSFRLNARSEDMLQAQLAVSSAVETIMAEGYEPDLNKDLDEVEDTDKAYKTRFPDVTISMVAFKEGEILVPKDDPETESEVTDDGNGNTENELEVISDADFETKTVIIYYELTVSDSNELVSVETCVRPVPTPTVEEGDVT